MSSCTSWVECFDPEKHLTIAYLKAKDAWAMKEKARKQAEGSAGQTTTAQALIERASQSIATLKNATESRGEGNSSSAAATPSTVAQQASSVGSTSAKPPAKTLTPEALQRMCVHVAF